MRLRFLALLLCTLACSAFSQTYTIQTLAGGGLPENIAKRAPEFLTKQNLDPRHISGLDAIMADAVKFKYLPAPLSEAQLAEVIQIPLK